MKKHLIIKTWEIPLYGGLFILAISNCKKKINKAFNAELNNIFAHSLYRNLKGRQGFVMVLNFYDKKYHITNGTISHEAYHVTGFISAARGMKADHDNDESLAYLNEWIVDTTHKFIKKKGLKIG